MSQVITRFAPSPTGFLHIGGARTALFNWLYAKKHGGKMLLRIEDTDRQRSTEEAVHAIYDGLSWLGLDWDGDPISQFSRVDRHREVAEQLLENGMAYRCFCTPEELDAMREEARAEGRPPVYNNFWRDKSPTEAPADAPFVVRIKTPLEGETWVNDKVQGDVRFPNSDIDDFVILRSDGTPTYMLAVVVDDHDMKVSHIIRGDDHLTNAARQTAIYNAMGWDVPVFAHIPLIHGADGAKLSKRHGALGAEAYRAMGYLPAALKNYLVRLGWAKGDEEIISEQDMISWFGFDGMNKAAARFDTAKLNALNGHYIRHADGDDLMKAINVLLQEMEGGPEISAKFDETTKPKLLKALPSLQERAKTLVELIENASFIYEKRPLAMNEKAAKLLSNDAVSTLKKLADQLTSIDDWSIDTIKTHVSSFVEAEGLKLGKVGPPLRAALTGTTSAPGIFEIMEIIGKEQVILRIYDQATT